jgi:UPF0755 protein
MLKNIFNFYIIFVVGAVLTLTAIGYVVVYLDADGILKEQKTILIEKGLGIEKISEKLSAENVIEHPLLFTFILRVVNRYQPIKAGEYDFLPANSPNQVIEILTSGKSVIHKLVIPEGTNSYEIIQKIKNEPLLEGEIQIEYKDGELLPDTYYFTYGDKKQYLLNKMNSAMIKAIDELWDKKSANVAFTSKQEAVTLASIIEKETRLSNERSRVSSVYNNRLKINMKLQADPTVIYAITEGKYELNRPLTYNDLKFDSPHNTYLYEGLPPSPITNPGRDSIEAALNPLITNEIYFVANGNGGHEFSDSIKGHLKNVADYRKKNKKDEKAKS